MKAIQPSSGLCVNRTGWLESPPTQQSDRPSTTPKPSDDQSELGTGQLAVRFASVNQEIEPERIQQSEISPPIVEESQLSPSPKAQEELRSLALSLQRSQLQESRFQHFAFEPVSLPPSRVRPQANQSSQLDG